MTYGRSRTEAIPEDISFPHSFKKQNPKLVQDTLDAMYTWAETPLKGKT